MGHAPECVKLIQRTKYRWDVLSPKGHAMLEGLYFASEYKALDWTKAYISTWPTWNVEVIRKELT